MAEIVAGDCLHRPGDVEALAAQLERALHDPAWRPALARRNVATASRFDRRTLDERRRAVWRGFAADYGIAVTEPAP
jgi:hypothetical protein